MRLGRLGTERAAGRPRRRSAARRGTVLVFVLGILALLSVIGFTLLASARSERVRVEQLRREANIGGFADSLVEQVRRRLRDDVWSPATPGQPSYLLNGSVSSPPPGADERNEPFDAPGPFDRWLASTTPFVDSLGPDGAPATGDETGLAWLRVSYTGSDAFRYFDDLPNGQRDPLEPAVFASPNASTGYDGDPPTGGGVFDKITVLDISSPNWYAISNPLADTFLPHGITIAQGRAFWNGEDISLNPNFYNNPVTGLKVWRDLNPRAQFPYFDRDLDGRLDLYDADGDGVPDSPLSFELTYDAGATGQRRLYAAVRIIDHGSMINLNTACALDFNPDNPATPSDGVLNANDLFAGGAGGGGGGPDNYLRGRRVSECLLDPEFDWDLSDFEDVFGHPVLGRDIGVGSGTNRVAVLINWRRGEDGSGSGRPYLPNIPTDYYGFYGGITRCLALGGIPFDPAPRTAMTLFNERDEGSLRNRFSLMPRDMATTPTDTLGAVSLQTNIDRALPETLQWSQRWLTVPPDNGRYDPNGDFPRRWFSFDTRKPLDITGGGPVFGFRELLDPDFDASIRRTLFTTISFDTTRIPTGGGLFNLVGDWQVRLPSGNWAPMRVPPPGGRVEKVDLNQPLDELDDSSVAAWLGWVAWAIYKADPEIYMAGVAVPGTPGSTTTATAAAAESNPTAYAAYGEKLKHRRALQLAANLLDFRDGNDDPTIIVNDSGTAATAQLYMPVVGVERQPFITEVFSFMAYGGNPVDDKYAVELYNPYGSAINAAPFELMWAETDNSVDPPTVQTYSATFAAQGVANFPAVGGSSNGYTVLRTSTTIAPDANAQTVTWVTSPGPEFRTEDDWVAVVRRIPIRLPDGTVIPDRKWMVDRMQFRASGPFVTQVGVTGWQNDPDESATGMPGDEVSNNVARDTSGWRFATSFAELRSKAPGAGADESDHDLGKANDTNANVNFGTGNPPQVEACPFVVRNRGLDLAAGNGAADVPPVWSLDSPTELSKVLAFGADWRDDSDGNGVVFDVTTGDTNFSEAEPITEWLARTGDQLYVASNPNDDKSVRRKAIGRVNWFENSPSIDREPGRLLWYLGCNLLGSDGINNDGDASAGIPTIDESDEAARLYFRNAGLININTAPAAVLRTVPYMTGPQVTMASQGWDLAAEIVAWRENRQLPARVNGLGPTAVTTDGPPNGARYFTFLSDLRRLPSLNKLATDNWPLRENTGDTTVSGPTFNVWSPEFDRAADVGPLQATSLRNDQRERDAMLSRWGNLLSVRSDVFTAYIAVFDENGRPLRRTQVTLDRSITVGRDPVEALPGNAQGPIIEAELPRIVARQDQSYVSFP